MSHLNAPDHRFVKLGAKPKASISLYPRTSRPNSVGDPHFAFAFCGLSVPDTVNDNDYQPHVSLSDGCTPPGSALLRLNGQSSRMCNPQLPMQLLSMCHYSMLCIRSGIECSVRSGAPLVSNIFRRLHKPQCGNITMLMCNTLSKPR